MTGEQRRTAKQSLTTAFETLTVSRKGAVVTVTLNRPTVHNALNAVLIGELTAAFEALAQDESVHVIVLAGNGRSFSAGADVTWMRESLTLSEEENIRDALRMSDMFAAIDQAPQAVVARVQGACLGGGMGLIAVCDIVIAAEDVQFGFTEVRLGIVPAVISRFVLPKIGTSWARRLFLTGERFDAARARDIGLIHEIVSPDHLDRALHEAIEALHASGPRAIREAKALISGLQELPAHSARGFTASRIAAVRTSPEGQEGLRAFLEKRPPGWAAGDSHPELW